jgi:hypothetical protein
MKYLFHTSERRYLDANASVLETLIKHEHEVIIWSHFHDIPANKGTATEYRGKGFSVIDGADYSNYDASDAVHIVNSVKPDIIVPIEHTILPWRKIYKKIKPVFPDIPIIAIQHSFGGLHQTYLEDRKREGWNTDWHLVWGEQGRDRYVFAGFPKEKIIVSGNPNWDQMYKMKTQDDGFILFVGGNPQNFLKNIDLLQIHQRFPRLRFYFKNHPNHPGNWEKTVSLRKGSKKFLYSSNMIDLIRRAKVVISSTSTCGIDSMLLNKPTIIVNMGEKTEKFIQSGRIVEPDKEAFFNEFCLCMDNKQNNEKVPSFLKYVSYLKDGLAKYRVIWAMRDIKENRIK